ncbi:MAG: twin-arginine translocase TatA/TatE family subunit [Chloroflexi bacterium]|nr:twin-arginine translocase TatA/TatE family subunit [Chloroflexota bacterium]
MNIFGIGGLELLVIMLVGFLILGPARMVKMSRKMGKTMSDVKKATSEFTDMVVMDEDEEEETPKRPPPRQQKQLEPGTEPPNDDSDSDKDDGPIPFSQGGQTVLEEGDKEPEGKA